MPIMSALGALGYARIGYASLPTGTGAISYGLYPQETFSGGLNYPTHRLGSILFDNTNRIIITGFSEQYNVTEGAYMIGNIHIFDYNGIYETSYRYRGSTYITLPTTESVIDSTNNLYTVGVSFNTNTSSLGLYVIKQDSSGTVLWQKLFGTASTSDIDSTRIATDGTDVYCLSSNYIRKITSSGTISWYETIRASISVGIQWNDLIVDNGYIYMIGREDSPNLNYTMVKISTSTGTVQWRQNYSQSFGEKLLIKNNKIYVISANGFYILDTDGNILSDKITVTMSNIYSGNFFIQDFDVDTYDNIYLTFRVRLLGDINVTKTMVCSFDSSFNLRWSNLINSVGSLESGFYGIRILWNSTNGRCYIISPGVDFNTITTHGKNVLVTSFRDDGYIPSTGTYNLTNPLGPNISLTVQPVEIIVNSPISVTNSSITSYVSTATTTPTTVTYTVNNKLLSIANKQL
jgi:hypothetical protein